MIIFQELFLPWCFSFYSNSNVFLQLRNFPIFLLLTVRVKLDGCHYKLYFAQREFFHYTMNTQITNSDFSKSGKFGEGNEYFPRKSLVSFAEKTESIDISIQVFGL